MSHLKDDKGTLVSEIIILPLKLQIVTLLSLPLVLCCSRLLTLKSLSIFLSFPLVLSLALGVEGGGFGLAMRGGRQGFKLQGGVRDEGSGFTAGWGLRRKVGIWVWLARRLWVWRWGFG